MDRYEGIFYPKRVPEYEAIKNFYGNRRAKRSQVPLLHHIHEGNTIMKAIGASKAARRGYMLHPLFQNDAELYTVGYAYAATAQDAIPVMLAMEYRTYANAWLSDKVSIHNGEIRMESAPTPGPNVNVKHMLIADKVQNRKDFELYHKGKHDRSKELTHYFNEWLEVLGVNEQDYQHLVKLAAVVSKQ